MSAINQAGSTSAAPPELGGLPRHEERTAGGRVRVARAEAPDADPAIIARELEAALDGEVRFDDGSRALYATDASNYRQVPVGIVIPRHADDVKAAIDICRRHGVPITSRGNGTGLAGQTCNAAVILDFSKYMNRILALDPERRLARVEPGCILDVLRKEAERHGLTFGPDPATHVSNTLGGMIGNNSCGPHSVQYGRTADNVEALEILTYDGLRLSVGPTSDEAFRAILAAGGRRADIYRSLDAFRRTWGERLRERYPKIPRRVSGYADLDQLLEENGFNVARALVGTEGTCVTILEATLRLVLSPPARSLVVLGFPDIFQAADAVPKVLEHRPLACEGLDHFLVDAMRRKDLHEDKMHLLPEGCDWLVVEFGGDTEKEADDKAGALARHFDPLPHANAKLVHEEHRQRDVWKVREAGLPGSAFVPERPETWEGWEDSAVPVDRLGDYLRDFHNLLGRYDYVTPLYGHFGDGLVHCRISFDVRTEDGIARWQRFLKEAADLVVSYGGSLSGEHGDGQSKAALLERMYGPELIEAFRAFKAIWDPGGLMNPGKVVDPYPITSNLRHGPSYHEPELKTHFAFRDEGGFADAAERCVGVGKCRRVDPDGGVMCPSFLATREEKHSTRGRARLLFEMVRGEAITDRWRSEAVKDALSLCLACKGCKSDCPVGVDMATYKAEFHAHYFARRLRPRTAQSMGRIATWASLGSRMPRLANFAAQAPGLSTLTKRLCGIAQERRVPTFAPQTFRDWFARRSAPNAGGRRVLLWPDTFNDHFRPEVAIAATRVLEKAGFEVTIPKRKLCCGRPLYDWGWLDKAKDLWRGTFAVLREDIEAGTPLVGLEPGCLSAFKDELPNLFPDDDRAKRLSEQSVYFSDFVGKHAADLVSGKRDGSALVQMHCHHHAVIKTGGERKLLDALGLDYEMLSSGCCGMAGAFGFDAETYEVSQTIAERALFPQLRAAPGEQMILANGFSCREQIEQGTGRSTLHIAELLERCLAAGRSA